MKVISNSSPLIVLHNCGQLEILQQLFGEVLIPDAVYQEVGLTALQQKNIFLSRDLNLAAKDFLDLT